MRVIPVATMNSVVAVGAVLSVVGDLSRMDRWERMVVIQGFRG
jgi:hypothetical protein